MGRQKPHWLIFLGAAFLVLSSNYQAIAGVFGEYELKDKVAERQLTVSKWQEPGHVKFEIKVEVAGESRWGGMSGVAALQGDTFTYADKECPLTVKFKGNQAEVSAPRCRDRFGDLPLTGVYKKKK